MTSIECDKPAIRALPLAGTRHRRHLLNDCNDFRCRIWAKYCAGHYNFERLKIVNFNAKSAKENVVVDLAQTQRWTAEVNGCDADHIAGSASANRNCYFENLIKVRFYCIKHSMDFYPCKREMRRSKRTKQMVWALWSHRRRCHQLSGCHFVILECRCRWWWGWQCWQSSVPSGPTELWLCSESDATKQCYLCPDLCRIFFF